MTDNELNKQTRRLVDASQDLIGGTTTPEKIEKLARLRVIEAELARLHWRIDRLGNVMDSVAQHDTPKANAYWDKLHAEIQAVSEKSSRLSKEQISLLSS